MNYSLSSVLKNEYRDFALYTVESRAIPNMIDGLKPSLRFYLYSSIQGKTKGFEKVSAVSGRVSEYGYNHGESSVGGAGALMAAPWNNNLCLLDARGAFGSRLIQETGAHRYIYTKLSDNFAKYVKDLDLTPKHFDPEHAPPAYYIPIIPLVLINGARGIATGFSCNILPRSIHSIVEACQMFVNGEEPSDSLCDDISFPNFSGAVDRNSDGSFSISGVFEKLSDTKVKVTEVPPSFDREKYVKHLYSLKDKGIITSFSDECDDTGFEFEIRFRDKNLTDTKINKHLNLTKIYHENINVIGPDSKLRQYNSAKDLIRDFVEIRLQFITNRIKKRKEECQFENEWLKFKRLFVESVIDEDIVFRGYKKNDLKKIIQREILCSDDIAERLLNMNVHSFTEEMLVKIRKEYEQSIKTLEFWMNTDETIQFNLDLKEIN